MPEIKDRLSVVETVYHQQYNQQPTSIENRFSRELETSDQVYSRKSSVGENWTELNYGWLENNVGVIIVSNEEGKNLQKVPTIEEKEEIAKRILEITGDDTCEAIWRIYPGESFRGHPVYPGKLSIRSLYGVTKYILSVIPR